MTTTLTAEAIEILKLAAREALHAQPITDRFSDDNFVFTGRTEAGWKRFSRSAVSEVAQYFEICGTWSNGSHMVRLTPAGLNLLDAVTAPEPQEPAVAVKRQMRNPAAFAGKRIDSTKWVIPAGYAICRMTGKFYAKDALEVTFNHHQYDKAVLVKNGIYVEDADWLSEEGYDLIISKLAALGMKAA